MIVIIVLVQNYYCFYNEELQKVDGKPLQHQLNVHRSEDLGLINIFMSNIILYFIYCIYMHRKTVYTNKMQYTFNKLMHQILVSFVFEICSVLLSFSVTHCQLDMHSILPHHVYSEKYI